MKVCIDSDQTGKHLKGVLVTYLRQGPYDVTDLGAAPDAQYPEVATALAHCIAAEDFERGILICGSGLGMAMAACKVRGVFAGTVSDPVAADRLARSNNAQIICLGAQFISTHRAKLIVTAFLGARFGDRPNARRMRELEGAQ